MLKLGPEGTQNGGTEQDAGNQLAHDRRLADPLHQLAHQPPADKQRDDLGQENHLGGPVGSPVRGEYQRWNKAEWESGQTDEMRPHSRTANFSAHRPLGSAAL